MIQEIKMPSMGLAILEVMLLEWRKNKGDRVEKDEVLAVGETDKVTIEIITPVAGYLVEQKYAAKDVVPVESIVAVVNTEKNEAQRGAVPAAQAPVAQVAAAPTAQVTGTQAAAQTGEAQRVSPLARKIAEANNIDLSKIIGTGPQGLIKKEDVLAAIEQAQSRQQTAATPTTPIASAAVSSAADVEIIPFSGIRKTIADNMMRSIQTAAHVTTTVEVDMTEVSELRSQIIQSKKLDSLSLLVFVAKAVALGIKDFPIINSSVDKDKILIKKYVNIGIAVASTNGLVVPVVKDVPNKGWIALGQEIQDLTEIARAGKMTPDRFRDGTITISNAGAYGAIMSTPIINQPQSAVIWFGAITKKPVVVNDEVVVRKMMYLQISYDHRVMDGATAAQYLGKVKKYLENPLDLLVI